MMPFDDLTKKIMGKFQTFILCGQSVEQGQLNH